MLRSKGNWIKTVNIDDFFNNLDDKERDEVKETLEWDSFFFLDAGIFEMEKLEEKGGHRWRGRE